MSELDAQLGEAYRSARTQYSPAKAKLLTAEQRQWLDNVRNRCTNTSCLQKVYEARLGELDPFADKQVTCAEMKRSPETVFSGGIDLGSGTASPIAVNYTCAESLDQQKFMLPLLGLAEKIRNEDGPRACTGTIVVALWRYYHFSLAKAGFAPTMLQQDHPPITADIDWNLSQLAGGNEADQKAIRYFKQWSEGSLFNLSLYKEFTTEFDRVLPILARHYETSFGMGGKDAQISARNALMLVVQRAAGSFPRSELKEESVLVRLVRDSRTRTEEIQGELANRRHAEDDIHSALAAALINNRPLQTVAALTRALGPDALQRRGGEQEALLSLALGSQQNLEHLLAQKVPVNAANDFGKTALFYAIGANNHPAADALVRAGADVNHAYKSAKELRPDGDECVYPGLLHTRRTPLMHAAQHSDVKMIGTLLKAGARLDASDDLGYNALDYAVLGTNKDNEAYLKSLGLAFGSQAQARPK